MTLNRRMLSRIAILTIFILTMTITSIQLRADTGTCGGQMITLPFTDVQGNPFFCSIASAFFTGLTFGTTATTFSPSDAVTRDQMAAFITRTRDSALRRGSHRAALNQWWTTQSERTMGLTSVGAEPNFVVSDGEDLWVSSFISGSVSQVHASNGKLLGTWITPGPGGIIAAMGSVFVTDQSAPGAIFKIDPAQPPGVAPRIAMGLGNVPIGIAFDGERLWTANRGQPGPGSVSIVGLNPNEVTTVETGFSSPWGVIFDGANIWVTDKGDNTIKKLDSSGAVLQSVAVGLSPLVPGFDGTNIWVPNFDSNTVTVIVAMGPQAGTIRATLTSNGLNGPATAAFDGERIMVTNFNGHSVSVWKAADLTPIGNFSTGPNTGPSGLCSDGLNFWFTLGLGDKLARF